MLTRYRHHQRRHLLRYPVSRRSRTDPKLHLLPASRPLLLKPMSLHPLKWNYLPREPSSLIRCRRPRPPRRHSTRKPPLSKPQHPRLPRIQRLRRLRIQDIHITTLGIITPIPTITLTLTTITTHTMITISTIMNILIPIPLPIIRRTPTTGSHLTMIRIVYRQKRAKLALLRGGHGMIGYVSVKSFSNIKIYES